MEAECELAFDCLKKNEQGLCVLNDWRSPVHHKRKNIFYKKLQHQKKKDTNMHIWIVYIGLIICFCMYIILSFYEYKSNTIKYTVKMNYVVNKTKIIRVCCTKTLYLGFSPLKMFCLILCHLLFLCNCLWNLGPTCNFWVNQNLEYLSYCLCHIINRSHAKRFKNVEISQEYLKHSQPRTS